MGQTQMHNSWLYTIIPVPAAKGGGYDAPLFLFCGWRVSCAAFALVCLCGVLLKWAAPGGTAWGSLRLDNTIPGPRGWPVLGSLFEMRCLAHRKLASLAERHGARSLMAVSLGNTRLVITCKPDIARDLLSSPDFSDRPLKLSAQNLLFARAIGFAPYGDYWRNLRKIAASHLFSPKRIAAHERFRQMEADQMIESLWMKACSSTEGVVKLRPFLQRASLNNIMASVFGRRYDFNSQSIEAVRLQEMVAEGFQLLGAFNFSDHIPALKYLDCQQIQQRCTRLVSEVKVYVQRIIDEHRRAMSSNLASSDFMDVLLSLQKEERLSDEDVVAILWEMIFRGSDTMAILTEWILAELVLNPEIQSRLHYEIDSIVGQNRHVVSDTGIAKMPFLQAVVKETLRLHPPGPLLSWARLSRNDTVVAGHFVPAGTTAMVNMWAITHDDTIWPDADKFMPERFMAGEGGEDVDIRGNDLRLAPFGSGRRVCPGRALGLATVHLWLARLLRHFTWEESLVYPVDLTEVLKLSCEMVSPLCARPVKRTHLPFQGCSK
eukprot:Gb_37719 [translate_table: standard]